MAVLHRCQCLPVYIFVMRVNILIVFLYGSLFICANVAAVPKMPDILLCWRSVRFCSFNLNLNWMCSRIRSCVIGLRLTSTRWSRRRAEVIAPATAYNLTFSRRAFQFFIQTFAARIFFSSCLLFANYSIVCISQAIHWTCCSDITCCHVLRSHHPPVRRK